MSTTMACRLGRHDWVTDSRPLDEFEEAQPMDVCSRCGKARSGGGQFDVGRRGGGDLGGGSGFGADLGGGGGGGDAG